MEPGKPIREVLQRIAFECQESGATKWEILKVLKELENTPGGEAALKKKAADMLLELNPEAAKTFLSFERMNVYTSAEKRQPFDRGNIIKSLLKETNVSRHVAEKIGGEVEDKIKDLRIDYLNTQIIREMVNVKLLEYGHEKVHAEYSRLGMPLFEVKKKLERAGFENPEILREYNWAAAIPKKARELHYDGAIHIYAPEGYSTKLFCTSNFFSGKKEDIALAACETDSIASVPTTIKAINFALAEKEAMNTQQKAAEQTRAFSKIISITKKTRACELALYSDDQWQGISNRKKSAFAAANAMLKDKAAHLKQMVAIDSKFQLKLLDKKTLSDGAKILNNSKDHVTGFAGGHVLVGQKGLVSLTGINLWRLIEQSDSEESFMEKFSATLEIIQGLAEEKQKNLAKKIGPKELEDHGNAIALAGISDLAKISQAPAKTAERIMLTAQKTEFGAMWMQPALSEKRFGQSESAEGVQKILFDASSRTKRLFGFSYRTASYKEAERLLGEVNAVTLEGNDNSL
ncbi:MAG: hypothetical protein NUV67_01270 [archaeon]|nr:hypothetical protein [archaeon]